MEPPRKKRKSNSSASIPVTNQPTVQKVSFQKLPSELRQHILNDALEATKPDLPEFYKMVELLGMVSSTVRRDVTRLVRLELVNTSHRVVEAEAEVVEAEIAVDLQKFSVMDARNLALSEGTWLDELKNAKDKLNKLNQEEVDKRFFRYRLEHDCDYLERLGNRLERVLLHE